MFRRVSFARIGFWKLIGSGIFLNLIHSALRSRSPEWFAEEFRLQPLFVRFLEIFEVVFPLLSLTAAAEMIFTSSTGLRSGWHKIVMICAWVAYMCFVLWVA